MTGSALAARHMVFAAAVLWAATLAAFWPGYALYDTITQYAQALSGVYDDWHPPAMAVLWRGLHRVVGGGAGPMLAVQLGGWWLGLGLFAAALAWRGQVRSGAAVLASGLLPPALGWQVAVLKDAQLAGALMAAAGLVGWWRLRGRRVPPGAWMGAAALLLYASLVRANGVFAVAPLLAGWASGLRPVGRVALAALLVAVGLVVAGPMNHRLLGAAESGVERTQALYDLAGIGARVPLGTVPGLSESEQRAVVAKGCATPYFWDPLGDDRRCARDLARLREVAPALLYADLARAVARHPLAYAAHRLAHWNATERWLVPHRWPGAAPAVASEPNALKLGDPGRVATWWQEVAGTIAETPLGWPVCWVVVALGTLLVAWPGGSDARRMAVALAASALALEASFAAVSIASDLRYHLWPMAASALAAVLALGEGAAPRRVWQPLAALLAAVVIGGGVARLVLPTPPQTYAGMLDWRG